MEHVDQSVLQSPKLTGSGHVHVQLLGEELGALTARDSRLQGYINNKNQTGPSIQQGNLDYLGDIGRNVVVMTQAFSHPRINHEDALIALRIRLNSRGAGYEELRRTISRDATLSSDEKIALLHDARAVEKTMQRLDGFCRQQLNSNMERGWAERCDGQSLTTQAQEQTATR